MTVGYDGELGRGGGEKELSHLLKGKWNKDVFSLLRYKQDKHIIKTTPYNTFLHTAFWCHLIAYCLLILSSFGS